MVFEAQMGEARKTRERNFRWESTKLLKLMGLSEGEVGEVGEGAQRGIEELGKEGAKVARGDVGVQVCEPWSV